ncbi:unnamed protein product, partial [Prunus brigantina]
DSSSASDISPTHHHSMQTRSKSGVTKRKDFADYECYHTSFLAMPELDEPSSYRVARYSPEWIIAMQEEISALNTQGTWTLVPPPPGVNIVGSKWIYKVKRNSDGSVSRQLDVKNAFLHGDLEEEVYMKQPQGFEDSTHPQYVCKLRKSLYGLKQAPRAWNAKFTGYLPAIGFKASQSDPSLFVKKEGSEIVILLLYVDDIILTGSSTSLVQTTIEELSSVFEMKDMGQLTYFLGLQISYLSTGSIFVSQQKYAKELLAKAGMTTCKACSTPCKPHTQVLQTEGEPLKDPSLYRSIVGTLQYLTFTRPDLAYSVNAVCQYMTNPSETHFLLVKRILRYIQGTMEYGITFSPGDMHLHAYSDADWAGDPSTRRSTTGFVVFIGSNPVSWQSKKQGSVSRSSTEAEYRALANTAADIAWVRQVLADLHEYLPEPPLLFCDNLSALALSSNPVQHSRIKHLDIDFHFIRERVQRRDIMVQYIPTEEQIADVFTKGLYGPVFVTHCINLRLGIPAEIEGGCLPK